jgi:DNA-directed RNA polymerase subunit RPC12/RpoP
MKICSKCGLEYADNMFEHNRNQCKNCRKEIMNKQNAKYYLEHKEACDEVRKAYNQENKEKLKEYQRNYREENKDSISEKQKEWYREHKDRIKENQKEYQRTRKEKDPVFKFRTNISTLISRALKQQGASKNNKSCLSYLPYTFEELVRHLEQQFEPWMTWQNYGRYDAKIWKDSDQSTWMWNLDHIIPQSDLLYSSMEDDNFKKCWALDNLRPYSAKQNYLDGVNGVRHNA